MIQRCPTALALIALVASACTDAPAAGWSGEVRDSAGVAVVRNTGAPMWSDGEAWRASEDLTIGGDEARPETLFGHVADVAVDDAGRMYVLDQQAQAVRVFRPDGRTVGTIGRPGEGPGELGRFTFSALVRGDTLLVVDWGQGRLSRFGTDGAFLASERLPTTGAARSWWAAGPDGPLFRSLERYTDDEGRWQGRDVLLRYRGEGTADTVLAFDYPQSDIGLRGAPNVPLVINTPSWTVLDDGRVAWLTLEDPRIRIHAPDGRLVRTVGSDVWTARAPTAAENRALEEKLGEKLEMLGGSRDAASQIPVEHPERLPAITAVQAGPDSTLWVQRMGAVEDVHPMAVNSPDPPSGWGGTTWDVLDREGRWMGSVELPAGFRLFRTRGDRLYGVRRGELDVEEVVRLRLERPERSAAAGGERDGTPND